MKPSSYGAMCLLLSANLLFSPPWLYGIQGCFKNDIPTDYRISLVNETVFKNYHVSHASIASEYQNPTVYIDVYDPDGIEAVWFTYRRANESAIRTEPMDKRPQGNTYYGIFSVIVSEPVTIFVIQFYANDTLGNTASSLEYNLSVHYYPYHYHDPGIVLGPAHFMLLIAGLSAGAIVILYVLFKRVRTWQSGPTQEDVLSIRPVMERGTGDSHTGL